MATPHDAPTAPLAEGRTLLKTTAHFRLSPATLQRDAELLCTSSAEPGGAVSLPPPRVLVDGLAGHVFLMCLERNPLGELWRVRTPEGFERLAHLLSLGELRVGPDWLRRLRGITHPTLVRRDVFVGPSGQIILMAEAPERTFAEWFAECRAQGMPGVPREELLGLLRPVAEVLDRLWQHHNLQHLGLHPGVLYLQGGQPRVSGFGLLQLLWVGARLPVPALYPRYAAPELFADRLSPRCDQYSLGLLFAELVTGVHPLGSAAHRSGRRPLRPDLSLLSAGDRQVIERALDPDPSRRFGNCQALIRALQGASAPEDSALVRRPEWMSPLVCSAPAAGERTASLDGFIHQLLALAAGSIGLHEYRSIRYRLEPGASLRHQCGVRLFPGAAFLRLEGFRQEWNADVVLRGQEEFVFSVRTGPTFWQRLVGRCVGLEIELLLAPRGRTGRGLSEASVVIRPFGCGPGQAARLLAETGPVLLESLRVHLQAVPDQRTQERLQWHQPLRIIPVVPGRAAPPEIACIGKDISARGIGFFLPTPLNVSHVYVTHPALPDLASIKALVKVVRGQRSPDGWYEVGALFAPELPTRP